MDGWVRRGELLGCFFLSSFAHHGGSFWVTGCSIAYCSILLFAPLRLGMAWGFVFFCIYQDRVLSLESVRRRIQ